MSPTPAGVPTGYLLATEPSLAPAFQIFRAWTRVLQVSTRKVNCLDLSENVKTK